MDQYEPVWAVCWWGPRVPPGAVQSQAGVCALHSDGGEECALLLWPGSPAPPHQQDQQDAQNQHHHSPGLTLLSPRTTLYNHMRSSCHHVTMSPCHHVIRSSCHNVMLLFISSLHVLLLFSLHFSDQKSA